MRREQKVRILLVKRKLLFLLDFMHFLLQTFLLISKIGCCSDQHRCVPYALIRFLKFNDLSEEVIEKIKCTSFSHFLDMPLCKVVNKDLDIIISKYVGKGQFLIGKEKMKFNPDDIAKILDLPKKVRRR